MKRTVFLLVSLLFLAGVEARWAVALGARLDVQADDLMTGQLTAAFEVGLAPGALLPDSLKLGDPAPTFVMRNIISGDAVYLRDYAGTTLRRTSRNRPRHVVVLSFWATWCEPCKKEIPLLMKIADGFADKPVKFFLVNTLEQTKEPTHTEDSVKAAISARGYTLPCLVDATGRVADSYRVRSLPALVVIDKAGVIRKINRGFEEGFESSLRTLLNDLVDK
jgi:thiol-disulfide isomerase/thioredoxin